VVNVFRKDRFKQALARELKQTSYTVADHKKDRVRPPHKLTTYAETRWGSMATHLRTACENWVPMQRVALSEAMLPPSVKVRLVRCFSLCVCVTVMLCGDLCHLSGMHRLH
jgi:hypothetical protein